MYVLVGGRRRASMCLWEKGVHVCRGVGEGYTLPLAVDFSFLTENIFGTNKSINLFKYLFVLSDDIVVCY